MPEGDTLHRAARRLQVLVGQVLEVEAPHPRAQATQVAEQIDGRRLESVEAVGKNLVLRFEGGVVAPLAPADERPLARAPARHRDRRDARGSCCAAPTLEGVLWSGPVLELHTRALARLGPDILASPPDFDGDARAPRGGRRRPTARRDAAGPAPRRRDREHVDGRDALARRGSRRGSRFADVPRDDRRRALETAARSMRASVDAGREPRRQVYSRAGRPCPRCGTPIRSRGQGDANRTAYWCPACQGRRDAASAS